MRPTKNREFLHLKCAYLFPSGNLRFLWFPTRIPDFVFRLEVQEFGSFTNSTINFTNFGRIFRNEKRSFFVFCSVYVPGTGNDVEPCVEPLRVVEMYVNESLFDN